MTDILPPAGWLNVRQLETNEFAAGGPNGNMNEQAKSLAARSELLKQYAALPYESKTGGYALNERVQLATGDIVRSTIPSNVNNPNENMTGWVKSNDASQIFDASGKTQQEINKLSKTVFNIAELKTISAENGDIVRTSCHTTSGLGAGTYIFEALSSKIDNGGSYIASTKSEGVWVLISENLYFEHFGVINDGLDQSVKMQACIDYAYNQQIYGYGFEKPNTYFTSSSLVFKPLKHTDITDFYSSEKKLTVRFNGAVIKPLVDNLIVIKSHREKLYLRDTNIHGNGKSGITAIRLGLHDEPQYSSKYRHSAAYFEADTISATACNIGIQFCPSSKQGSSAYGMYYHDIGNIDFKNVTHGLVFEPALDGTNQTTRMSVGSYSHNTGACCFVGLNAESVIISSFMVENIKQTSALYPDASQRAVYIPKIGLGMNESFPNQMIRIRGVAEQVTYPIFCEGVRCEIDLFSTGFNGASDLSLYGNYNSGSGLIGYTPMCRDMDTFHFPYSGARFAVVGILSGSPGVASLPTGMTDGYGAVQWFPTSNSASNSGFQLFYCTGPTNSVFVRRIYGSDVATATKTPWINLNSSIQKTLPRYNRVVDVNANTLILNNEEATWGVSFSAGNGAALNSPSGGEFYGAIKFIPTLDTQGVQVAYGTSPNVMKKRNYNGTTWTAWQTVTVT